MRINTDEPNRLRRDTAFLCNIRFRNDLPEVGAWAAAVVCGCCRGGRRGESRSGAARGAQEGRGQAALLAACPSPKLSPSPCLPPLPSVSPPLFAQIPCDPKLLLPPYDRQAVSAFKLTGTGAAAGTLHGAADRSVMSLKQARARH